MNVTLIPPQVFDSVVAIEQKKEGKYHTVATGFLVGFPTGSKNDKGEDTYYAYLVTNRHVFDKEMCLWLRFNKKEGSHIYELGLKNEKAENIWAAHPNSGVDVAVVKINPDILRADGIVCQYILTENMAFRDIIKKEGIKPGDGVFVLGFPMELSGKELRHRTMGYHLKAR